MQAIVFDYVPSSLNIASTSLAMRASYLIADLVLSAGDTYGHVGYEKFMDGLKPDTQMRLLHQHHLRGKDAESATALTEIMSTYKRLRKIKGKGKNEIVLMKKIEQTVNSSFKLFKDEMVAKLKHYGYVQLQPLFEDNLIDVYPMSTVSPEEKGVQYLPASELLTLTAEGSVPGELFCMTAEFFLPEFSSKLHIAANDGERSKEGTTYFEPLFRFPNINAMLAPELTAVRNQLRPEAQVFCKAVDEWVRLSREGVSLEESCLWFEKVREASLPLKDSIEKNETLLRFRQYTLEAHEIEALFGEVPVAMIWDFYRHFKPMRQETDDKISALKDNKAYRGRWPVMLLRYPLKKADESPTGEQEIAPVKKSLSID